MFTPIFYIILSTFYNNYHKNSIKSLFLKLDRYFLTFIIVIASLLNLYSQVVNGLNVSNSDTLKSQIKDSVSFGLSDTIFLPKDTTQKALEINNASVNKPKKNKLEAPFDYKSADSIIFNLDTKEVILYGNAEVNYQSINLKADIISINMDSKIIYAYGNTDSTGKTIGKPHFKDGNDEFEADTIRYNLDTKKGIIKGVITEQGGGFLHSSKTKKLADNSVCLIDGKYTTCDHEHPHFYLSLSKARVIPDDKIVSGPAYLVIEDVPLPIGLPFGIFPNQGKHASGLIIPTYGEEDNRGFFLRDGGYYFHINDYVDFKVLFDFYTNSSWGTKLMSNYKKRYKFQGDFKIDYSDMIIGENFEPNATENKVYWIKWNHRQDSKARPNSNFSASVNMGSSKYKAYNSTNYNDRLSGTTNSAITYRLTLPNTPFTLNLAARQSQSTTSDATQNGYMDLTLPEFSFNMSRIYPFKKKNRVGESRWYEKIGITYNTDFKNIATKIHEDTIFTQTGFENFRNGLKHTIPFSTSMKFLKYLNFSPSFNYNERWYFKSINREYFPQFISGTDTLTDYFKIDTLNKFARSGDYLISLPVTTKLYGMYQFVGKDPVVQAIRHTITPSVSFSWRPDFSESKYGYYQTFIKQNGEEVKYSIFDGGSGNWTGIYGSAPAGKYGSIGLSLNNNLEMKVRNRADSLGKGKKISLLNSFAFSTSYNMAVDSIKWSSVGVRANTTLLKVLRLNFSTSLNLYDIDTLGRKINVFLYNSKKEFARLENWNVSIGATINSKGISAGKNKTTITQTQEDIARATATPIVAFQNYSDFSVPWNLNLDYSLIMSKSFVVANQNWESVLTQTLRFSGDISLTKNWKFNYTSGYDLEKHEFAYTALNFVRDLHCWEMSLNLIPFGTYKSYTFTIHVKSAMLKDLELPMRRNWIDNFDK